VISYPAMLDVSVKLIRFVAGLLRKERKALGTRKNTRALTCWYQAVLRSRGSGTSPTSHAMARRSASPKPPRTGT
jgi:hypothetical protein